jgi:autotransporter-associated beta strand protein
MITATPAGIGRTHGLAVLLVCLSVLCAGASPAFAQAVSNLYPGKTSIFVPFVNAPPSGVIDAVPQMAISLGSSPALHAVNVDTGSQGIAVSRDFFDPTGPGLGRGSITYTSSGVVNRGSLHMALVHFHDRGRIVATAQVRVLVVDAQTCLRHARHCTPDPSPHGVLQMGVGFGQEMSGQPDGVPAANPFLNIVSPSAGGVPSRGYVVTAAGVLLGLTQAGTQGYAMVKLAPFRQVATPARPEWVLAPASVAVDGMAGFGAVLSDTGVVGMYLSPDIGTRVDTVRTEGVECGAACFAPGTRVQVSMPDEDTPIAGYAFTVGVNSNTMHAQAGNPVAPNFVALVPPAVPSFVNTAVSFFNGYDYLYDAENGFVGYRQTGSAADTSSVPAFALQGLTWFPAGFANSLPIRMMAMRQVSTKDNVRGFIGRPAQVVAVAARKAMTLAGPISGTPELAILAGVVTLSARNDYTGRTRVARGSVLALAGTGSIAASAGVVVDGILDISQAKGEVSIASLSGAGTVRLGARVLTIAAGMGDFHGTIIDGGIGGGHGGRVAAASQ